MAIGYNYGNGVEKAKIFESGDEFDYFTAVVVFSDEDDGFPSAYKLSEKLVARSFAVVDGETVYGETSEPMSVYDVAVTYRNNAEIYNSLSDEQKSYIDGIVSKVENAA